MKKLVSMYQKYMFRPILYKSVTRVSVVAVLMLLWDRYVSDGTFTMWQAPALLLGVVLLMWAWVNYLRLDGVTIHHLGEEFKDLGKRRSSTPPSPSWTLPMSASSPSRSWNRKSAPIAACSRISSWAGRCSSSASSQAQCEGSGHGRKSENSWWWASLPM